MILDPTLMALTHNYSILSSPNIRTIPYDMNEAIRALEPKALWNYFADLNAIPRPSKEEERVIAFVKKFGEDLGLKTVVDHGVM